VENDDKLKVATFRFGIISVFVNGVQLDYGEREKLLGQILARSYQIPGSKKNRISRSCIQKWIRDYKKSGRCLESLYPKERSDKGTCRSLSDSMKMAIKDLRKEFARMGIPAMINQLRHKKLLGADEYLNESTIYRYLRGQELFKENSDAVDKRLFEACNPNEIWQSDVMHGPYVKTDTKKSVKSYLIAIIDDHSRFIIHAEFMLSENRESFLDCLRQGILKRGLPSTLYIDNGSCFRALHLEQVAAQLGIGIKHSRPYTPQGRGKIERWFKYVRENFLIGNQFESLDLLNHHFENWVDEYNNKIHGSTKQTPYDRYRAGIECIRPAPARLLDYFRQIEFRSVKKDRTIRLMGSIFEAPVGLIDRKVELRFHPEDLSQVEIYFQNKSYGMIAVVDAHVNSKIGRDWKSLASKTAEAIPSESSVPTGSLFERDV
jgi:transposase InsO family protein